MSRRSLDEWILSVKSKTRPKDYIQDLIPGSPGYSLIAGPAGLGKTNIGLNLAFSMATGRDYLWFTIPEPVKVGMLTFEGAEDKLLDRIEKLETSFNKDLLRQNFWFERWPSTYLGDSKQRDRVMEFGEGLNVLILDPIKNMVWKDPSKTEVAHTFLEWLKLIYEKLGCHVILMHHVHKIEAELLYSPVAGDIQALKGSSEYGDSAETVMIMRRVQGRSGKGQYGTVIPDLAVLSLAKVRNQAEDMPVEETIGFDRATLKWCWPII